MNDREQNSLQSNKPSACWRRVAKLLHLKPLLFCFQEGEAEEKQLEGQREVLQKAQVKRKRYEGVLAQFWAGLEALPGNPDVRQPYGIATVINIASQEASTS